MNIKDPANLLSPILIITNSNFIEPLQFDVTIAIVTI